MSTPPDTTPPKPPSPAKARKPYEAPAVLSCEPLEVFAGLCTPSPPAKSNFGKCPEGPGSS